MSAVIKFEQEQKPVSAGLSQHKKLIYIVLIVGLNVAAAAIIYQTFKPKTSSQPAVPLPAVTGPGQPPSTAVPGGQATSQAVFGSYESFQQFVDQLIRDLSILNDPKYQLLKSLGVKVPVVKSGRENPFAPY